MLSEDQLASLHRWAGDGKKNELNLTLPEIETVLPVSFGGYSRRVIYEADLIQNAVRELLRHLYERERYIEQVNRSEKDAWDAAKNAYTNRRDVNATAVLQGILSSAVSTPGKLDIAVTAYKFADAMEQARVPPPAGLMEHGVEKKPFDEADLKKAVESTRQMLLSINYTEAMSMAMLATPEEFYAKVVEFAKKEQKP